MNAARLILSTALLITLASCSSGSDDQPAAKPASATSSPTSAASTKLVSLGDSFTAGPGIGDVQPGSGFCQRSDDNWPSLLATQTGLELHDVSCIGATTDDLEATLATGVLDSGAQLVTIGTGGNDSGLFSSLITSCATGGAACKAFVEGDLPRILDTTVPGIAQLLKDVRAKDPRATVLLVGYPRIVPDSGTCPALGVPASDISLLASAEEALDQSLAAAAKQAGETYVSMRDASRGHDACAGSKAWTNGRSGTPGDGISFHPTALGMRAVAQRVAEAAG